MHHEGQPFIQGGREKYSSSHFSVECQKVNTNGSATYAGFVHPQSMDNPIYFYSKVGKATAASAMNIAFCMKVPLLTKLYSFGENSYEQPK
jgi:hypothetical protein